MDSDGIDDSDSASRRHVAELHQTVRADLNRGVAFDAIINRLVAEGYAPELARRYVYETASGADGAPELRLAAYPRAAPAGGILCGTGQDLVSAARAFHWCSGAMLAWLGSIVLLFVLSSSMDVSDGGWTFWALYVVTQLIPVWLAIRGALQAGKPLGWSRVGTLVYAGALLLIPCGSFLLIVSVSSRLTEFLKKARVPIGFLGPNRDALVRAVALRGGVVPPSP